MEYLNLIPILVDNFNSSMDRFIPGICVVVLFGRVLQYTLKRFQKDGFGKAIYLGTLACIEAIALVFIIGLAPQFASRLVQNYFHVSTVFLRWMSLYALIFLFAFLQIPKHSRIRGLASLFILLTTFVLGWLYARWVGLIFVSMPIVLIFLHVMDRVAQVIIP